MSNTTPAPTDAELQQRCAEIIEWQRTGVLPGNALRAYAALHWAGHFDSLQMAERDTSAQAMEAIARWGAQPAASPAPVVAREPVAADDIKEPKNGRDWRVEWWNESCRMMLPACMKLDSFQSYKNGTLMFTLKKRTNGGITSKEGGQHGA